MSVYGWGSNRFGELGTTTEGTSTKHEPTLLDNFDGHLAAECASGAVDILVFRYLILSLAQYILSERKISYMISTFEAIIVPGTDSLYCLGEGHSLVLTEGGQVYAFGKGNEGIQQCALHQSSILF